MAFVALPPIEDSSRCASKEFRAREVFEVWVDQLHDALLAVALPPVEEVVVLEVCQVSLLV